MNSNEFYITYESHWHLDLVMPSKDWFKKCGETPSSWYRNEGGMLHGLADYIEQAEKLSDDDDMFEIEDCPEHVSLMMSHGLVEKFADKEGMSVDQYCHDYDIHRHWYEAQEGNSDNFGMDFCDKDGDEFTWLALDNMGRSIGEAIAEVTITPTGHPGVVFRTNVGDPSTGQYRARKPYGGVIGYYKDISAAAEAAGPHWSNPKGPGGKRNDIEWHRELEAAQLDKVFPY